MSIEMDMEVFLADVFEELDIMSEGNRDKIEMICSLQEEICDLRKKQIEIFGSIYTSGQKKFTKDPDRKRRLLLVFSQLVERFPKINITIRRKI